MTVHDHVGSPGALGTRAGFTSSGVGEARVKAPRSGRRRVGSSMEEGRSGGGFENGYGEGWIRESNSVGPSGLAFRWLRRIVRLGMVVEMVGGFVITYACGLVMRSRLSLRVVVSNL